MSVRVAENRAQGVKDLARFFDYDHLPGNMRSTSKALHDTAEQMIATLPDSAELTAGLRKLLEAKDCFVRAALTAS